MPQVAAQLVKLPSLPSLGTQVSLALCLNMKISTMPTFLYLLNWFMRHLKKINFCVFKRQDRCNLKSTAPFLHESMISEPSDS